MGADTLPEAHRFMLAEEFWVAGMTPHLRTRAGRKTLQAVEQLQPKGFKRLLFQYSMHRAPATLEMTHARTIRGARKIGLGMDGPIRLFACHYALGAFEYCLEIVEDWSASGMPQTDAGVLAEIALDAIGDRSRKATIPFVLDRMSAKLETVLRKLFR